MILSWQGAQYHLLQPTALSAKNVKHKIVEKCITNNCVRASLLHLAKE